VHAAGAAACQPRSPRLPHRSHNPPPTAGGGGGGYVNLADASAAHRGADLSLAALYGEESAMWIDTHAGRSGLSRAQAARVQRAAR
jgi:hypothetical protein